MVHSISSMSSMKRLFVICLAAVATLVLPACQQSKKQVQYTVKSWPLKQFKGSIIETEHYRIHTTVDDAVFHRACAELVEGQFDRYRRDLKIIPRDKMVCYVFANRLQWEAFTKATMGARARDYLRIRDGGYSANDISALYYLGRYPTLAILAHEVFHQYLDCASDEPVPPWINEGLACYYEAHEWDRQRVVFTPEKNTFRREILAQSIQADRLFPLRQILSTHAGKISKLSRAEVGTYYSQVWAMVRFLREGEKGKYAQPFNRLLAELGSRNVKTRAGGYLAAAGTERLSFGESVFLAYITEELDRFEHEFEEYTKQLAGFK